MYLPELEIKKSFLLRKVHNVLNGELILYPINGEGWHRADKK